MTVEDADPAAISAWPVIPEVAWRRGIGVAVRVGREATRERPDDR